MEDEAGRALKQHFARMESDEQADAYAKLILWFARAGYDIVAKARGSGRKNDVHFQLPDGDRPYALIVNKRDLLFYFRSKATKPQLSGTGLEVQRNASAGEMTVRIANVAQAELVIRTLS